MNEVLGFHDEKIIIMMKHRASLRQSNKKGTSSKSKHYKTDRINCEKWERRLAEKTKWPSGVCSSEERELQDAF